MKLVHIVDTDQNMWIDIDVFFQQSEMEGEFKHEVRQFEKSYDNQQAEQISLMV